MASPKRRIEQQEERHWHELIEATDQYLEGRSLEDYEYFCVHGYLPEVPTPGPAFHVRRLPWKERWMQFKNLLRTMTSKTEAEREFFCANGYWPVRSKDHDDGNN